MREQILEWLRRGHDHVALRTVGGIASYLQFDPYVVQRELEAMTRQGLLRIEKTEDFTVYYVATG